MLDAKMASEKNGTKSPESSVNGEGKRRHSSGARIAKEKSKKRKIQGGSSGASYSRRQRKHSMSKAAREPRDEPESEAFAKITKSDGGITRSPSPVIDFDGLSRPSKFFPSLLITPLSLQFPPPLLPPQPWSIPS